MLNFLKTRWVLFFVLIIFVAFKIPHLYYPYYWDESWPYAVAIRDMYKHGISLMPSAIDPELSRGHPLFFHVIAAIWMHIFGASLIAMHSFALGISLLCLIAVYEAAHRLFNHRVAVISILLISTQVFFFVQSSFVLVEVLVALLAFISLYFYATDKFLLAALSLSCLFFTKESGLVLGFVLGVDSFIGLFYKNNKWKLRLIRAATVIIPCLLIAAFFIYQKHIRGWYIFPLHNTLIIQSGVAFSYNFRMNCINNVFHVNFRYYYFILILLLSVITAMKNRSFKYLLFFLPAIIIYYNLDPQLGGKIRGIPYFISFIVSIAFILYMLNNLKIYTNARQKKFIFLSVASTFCFFCFSSMIFFTFRYLIAASVLLFFFVAVICDKFVDRTYPVLYYPVLLLILLTGFISFKNDNNYGDCGLKAFYSMDVQQSVVDYLEKTHGYDKIIGCGSFLEYQHLANPATGFLHSDKVFKNVSWNIDANTQYAIFDNIEPDYRYNNVKNGCCFHLVFRYQKGEKWAEIYCRN